MSRTLKPTNFRTRTPLSRWWNSSKSTPLKVSGLLALSGLALLATYRAHSRSNSVTVLAVEVAMHYNHSIVPKAPQVGTKTYVFKNGTVIPTLIDCEGDVLNMNLQYDEKRHIWLDFVGTVNKKMHTDKVLVNTAMDATHCSLESIKSLKIVPSDARIRVIAVHHYVLPKLWKITWEVLDKAGNKWSIGTKIDDGTGLPVRIHNECPY